MFYFYNVVEEESEFPPFERGYSYQKRTAQIIVKI